MNDGQSRKNRRSKTRPRTKLSLGNTAPTFGEALESRLMMAADVLTYHNDNMRTGQNLDETILTPANVNVNQFGKVGQVPVDGRVFAQPLYVSNVAVPGAGTHNIVFVATEHDSVYAFDADTLALLWHDSFINPAAGVTTIPGGDLKGESVGPEIGITGTPVIDPSTNTLYVVDVIKVSGTKAPAYFQQLHALDLATGAEKFGAPATIQATVVGRGAARFRGHIAFSPFWEFQRSGLLLNQGVVYVSWASYGDQGPYHGWVLGYNAQSLQPVSAFNVTPNGKDGGIWMSGGAPAADAAGNIYLSTGNGTFSANLRGGRDYGDTVLKLINQNGLRVADYFTPFNQARLNALDLDLSSGGVLLLPDQPGPNPHELVIAGKVNTLFLINRDNMGRLGRKSDRVVQEITGAIPGAFSTPAYFNGTIYYVGTSGPNSTATEPLKAFQLVNGRLNPTPTVGAFPASYPGSSPSISANGNANGIVWTLEVPAASASSGAILRAYDASDITHELYDSTQAGLRDRADLAVKFAVPTVANGRVFVGGLSFLTVYGLLPTP